MAKTVEMKGPPGLVAVRPEQVKRMLSRGYTLLDDQSEVPETLSDAVEDEDEDENDDENGEFWDPRSPEDDLYITPRRVAA